MASTGYDAVDALLARCRDAEIRLWPEPEGARIGYEAPETPEADALLTEVAARREAVLLALAVPLGVRVLLLAAELDWPRVTTVSGQAIGPGEADWRRVVESPCLVEPVRGIVLGGLRGALTRRLVGVPADVSWSEWEREHARNVQSGAGNGHEREGAA
jgi:hypothetical protein